MLISLIDQLPEAIFSAVFLFECLNEPPVRWEGTIIVYDRVAGFAFGKMARGVAVARRFSAIERIAHHGAADKGRGKRVRGLKGVSGIGERVIGIAIQLIGPRQDEPCRAIMRGPIDKKAQGRAHKRIGLREGQGLFLGLDIVEIR